MHALFADVVMPAEFRRQSVRCGRFTRIFSLAGYQECAGSSVSPMFDAGGGKERVMSSESEGWDTSICMLTDADMRVTGQVGFFEGKSKFDLSELPASLIIKYPTFDLYSTYPLSGPPSN